MFKKQSMNRLKFEKRIRCGQWQQEPRILFFENCTIKLFDYVKHFRKLCMNVFDLMG
jgi:hypothetical protein